MSLPSVVFLSMMIAAGGPAVKASKFELGTRAFNEGQFDAAIKYLDQAAMEGGDNATVEKIHLLRAQCFSATQNFARAEEAFALALEANPDASLDPARVDPTLVKMLEAVRGRLTGTLLINSTPSGASLFLDGKNAGMTPQTLTVPVGRHKLEARWGEGPLSSAELQLRPRKEIRVEWIQGAVERISVPTEPPRDTTRPIRFVGEARGTMEVPSNPGAYITPGFDVGAAVEFWYARVGLTARVVPYAGVAIRGALQLPIIDKVGVFIEGAVPFWFRNGGVALGFSFAAGGEFMPLPWFGLFGLVGGEPLLLNPGRVDNIHFIATAGIRLRVP